MKTILAAFLFSVSLSVSAQTYVKVADKPEYAKYLAWCNTPVFKTITQTGKIKMLKVNGQYTDSLGRYYDSNPVQITWFSPATASVTAEPWERIVMVRYVVTHQKRKPSITDFYTNWKNGLVGN